MGCDEWRHVVVGRGCRWSCHAHVDGTNKHVCVCLAYHPHQCRRCVFARVAARGWQWKTRGDGHTTGNDQNEEEKQPSHSNPLNPNRSLSFVFIPTRIVPILRPILCPISMSISMSISILIYSIRCFGWLCGWVARWIGWERESFDRKGIQSHPLSLEKATLFATSKTKEIKHSNIQASWKHTPCNTKT